MPAPKIESVTAERAGEGTGLIARFAVMKGAVRELWIVFGVKLLAILAYGLMNSTLVLWLSSDLGYDDKTAGYFVAAWSMVMTVSTVLVGSFVDAVGLRKGFLLGLGICLVSRSFMTFSTSKWLVLPGLFVMAVGESLLTPVLIAGAKRYATTKQRSMSFAILYAVMNLAFAIGGWTFDWIRSPKHLGEYGQMTLPVLNVTLSSYRMIFLLSTLLALPTLAIIYFWLREGVEVTDEGVKIQKGEGRGGRGEEMENGEKQRRERRENAGAGMLRRIAEVLIRTLKETVRIFAGLWKQPGFYKFLVFLTVVAAVRMIIYQMYYTYPKFGIRELGNGSKIGTLWSINNILIVFLVPIVGALTQKVAAYRMVTLGTFISAGSLFFMALPVFWFQGLADGVAGDFIGHKWLGVQGAVHPYYVIIPLFVLFYSIGEALWSPRLYEYSAAVAPKGQEGSYLSMSFLPYLGAKLFVGFSGGYLLSIYCPESGPRNSQLLWLIIALPGLITPIGLFVLRKFIQVKEEGRAV